MYCDNNTFSLTVDPSYSWIGKADNFVKIILKDEADEEVLSENVSYNTLTTINEIGLDEDEEILVDSYEKKAYVSSPLESSIYVIDLKTMLLKQKIKVNGMCERLYLTDDSTKLFYNDKNTGIVWVIDIYGDYTISEMGTFPCVSKIVFTQNKVYMLSRSKNKLAVVDYVTRGLIQELDVPKTPVDMIVHKNNLVILGGNANEVWILDTKDDVVVAKMDLHTQGFSTTLTPIKNTDIVLVTDTKVGKYCVINVSKKLITKTNNLFIPVSRMVVIDKKYGSSNK